MHSSYTDSLINLYWTTGHFFQQFELTTVAVMISPYVGKNLIRITTDFVGACRGDIFKFEFQQCQCNKLILYFGEL